MRNASIRRAGALALLALILAASVCNMAKADHKDKGHGHDKEENEQVYKGYFDDDQVKMRPLSDWRGDWQSLYPLLMAGTLDEFLAYKAGHGDKSVEGYRDYYATGYRTDVGRIVIKGGRVTFEKNSESFSANYVDDGFEILTYKKGNRGVRFIFRKSQGDDQAPEFIQFSDHRIAPEKSDHYHIYWGNDRAALLKEVTNWPTYFPSSLSGKEISGAMIKH